MSKKRKYVKKQIDDSLKLTKNEILKFGHITYINEYFNYLDTDDIQHDLHVEDGYPKKYECGCEVVVYDNFADDPDCRNVYTGSRIIKSKIKKVNNCEYHLKIVNKRKELLNELNELEANNGEFIPCVVRENNENLYHRKLHERDIITQTVELN